MLSENIQNIIIVVVFLGVIAAIAFDVIDMLVAALLGVSVLIFAGNFTQQDILNVTRVAGGPWPCCSGAWWWPGSSCPPACSSISAPAMC